MRKIKTTKIGKKEYVEVDERIRLFWSLHPTWSIITEMVYNCEQEMVTIFKATVIDDKDKVRATGHAREFQADKKSMVNKTSHIENCETSAIGRALGVKGIITEYGIASADEVRNAIEQEKVMGKVEGGEQKVVMEVEPNAETVAEASQAWKDQITGKKKAPAPPQTATSEEAEDVNEKEEEYLVEFNRRVSTLKNSTDAKALANEGREWSNNWTYKKDVYKTLYACISESFAAFKRSEDNAEAASLKGGS